MVKANEMTDRGSNALKTHMSGCEKLEMRQTRRGWLQECLGCEAQTEFKYFIGETQVFHSLEDAGFFCRCCCQPCHPYTMTVKELNTEAEIVTVDRPFRCGSGSCKCCCYQEATFTSGGNELGRAQETCWFCVPSLKVFDHTGSQLYLIHPPTCCGGICVNCCAEGNPCGKGCCKESFRIFPADAENTNGDAPYLGLILKKPKSLATEIFTDAQAFEVEFPKGASADQKGILIGMGILINSIFYEGESDGLLDAALAG
ncbi:scramblase [Nitzschia inconspicua]|uniref:Phospholipid scramblase n=1 Tax=Nitzschia inconspicua TaxID=303405 RepID=A0A9K3P7R1_9STRA|nr:scramblase [Nitzschia inconspicua]KAG7358054.1 scramblase [Nitzschia inconspicua]